MSPLLLPGSFLWLATLPTQPSPNATLQTRGSNPAMTIPMALSLPPAGVQDAAVVALPDNPAERRDCLDRHRFFPLLCNTQNRLKQRSEEVVAASPPPPVAGECNALGGKEAICHYGRGRCLYDDKRGWFCACDAPHAPGHPRGLHLRASAVDHALAPDCIDIGGVESGMQGQPGPVPFTEPVRLPYP